MLEKGTLVQVDDFLIKAVKYALDQLGIHPDNLPQKKRRTSLDGIGYGGSGYNGYFTIKLRTLEDGTQKIVVCDGASYYAEKGTSGESVARVNNIYYYVKYVEIGVPTASSYILLHFVPPVYDSNGDLTNKDDVKVEVVMTEDPIQYQSETYPARTIYVVGQVVITDGTPSVIQRHGASLPTNFDKLHWAEDLKAWGTLNGVAVMEYYENCRDLVYVPED